MARFPVNTRINAGDRVTFVRDPGERATIIARPDETVVPDPAGPWTRRGWTLVARDAAGELGTCEDDCDDCLRDNQLRWAPDAHRYIALANRVLAGFVIVSVFAAGFLVALIWKGIS